jgi:hypothetical protein
MIIKEGNSTVAIRIQKNENLIESLRVACKNYGIESGVISSGIGMFEKTELAYWNGERYIQKEFDKLVEVVSLQGNIGINEDDGETVIHLHGLIAGEDYQVFGGHIIDATVYNCEIFISKLHNITLLRKKEPSGLNGLFPA